MPPAAKARWWCLTVNSVGDEARPKDPFVELGPPGHLAYFCFQLERAPVTGRLHFQGVVRFSVPKSMDQVKAFLGCGDSVHLEPSRDPSASIKYCKKEDSRVEGPWEGGDSGHQGRRTDIEAAAAIIRGGGTVRDVALEHPSAVIKYGKGLMQLEAALRTAPWRHDLKVFCLVGAPRTGKTRCAWECFPDLYPVADMSHPWFDGYQGQKVILFDEMGPGVLCLNFLKKILDRYPCAVPVKGGFVPLMATTIFLTSNYPMSEWYPKASPVDFMALSSRMLRQFVCDTPQQAAAAQAEVRLLCGLLARPASPVVGARAPSEVSDSDYGAAAAGVLSVLDSDEDDPRPSPVAPPPVVGAVPDIREFLVTSSDDDGGFVADGESQPSHFTPRSMF